MLSLHRLILTYMVATIMHVPFPVFDGDNLKSGQTRSVLTTHVSDIYDVDFILLGCNPPDDSDDGPVDDDPEDGSNSVFGPSYSYQETTSQFISHLYWHQHELVDSGNYPVARAGYADKRAKVSIRYFSFGKLHQGGTAHLRC